MDSCVAEEMLSQLEHLDCPFVCDVDASYLSQLLLAPSHHRMRILSWLFSQIDIDIRNEIEAFHCNSASITSSAEVDQQTQLLTNIGASLGLCCPTDFSLIKGKSCTSKHLALWKNLLTIATDFSKDNDSLEGSGEIIDQVLETILSTCDIATSLSNSFHILSPAIEKDLNISLKIVKSSNSKSSLTITELSDKLESLQNELDRQLTALENFKKSNPNLLSSSDDPSLLETVSRSLSITSTDLAQLQTSFLQVFDHHFQPYCDKEPMEFTRLGSIIHNVDKRLSSFLTLFENLKKLKEAYQEITQIRLLDK